MMMISISSRERCSWNGRCQLQSQDFMIELHCLCYIADMQMDMTNCSFIRHFFPALFGSLFQKVSSVQGQCCHFHLCAFPSPFRCRPVTINLDAIEVGVA